MKIKIQIPNINAVPLNVKGEYKLKSSDKSKIKSHLRNMEREAERFQKQMEKDQKEFFKLYSAMLSNSDITVKR